MRANIRLSTPVDGAKVGSLNVKNGRIRVARLTRNGPELDAETSELGPDQHLSRRCG